MAYKINDKEFHAIIQVPDGTRYEVDELYRYVRYGQEFIQAAVRVREEGRKNVTLGLLREVESPMVFLETITKKWRGSGGLPENKGYGNVREIMDHDLRRHYAQQTVSLPKGSLDVMIECFEWQILTEAYAQFRGNQTQTALALRMPRAGFQDYLKRVEGKTFPPLNGKKVDITLGAYREMVRQCELILLKDAFAAAERNHTKAAELLQVPRSTFSERLKKLGISA